MKVRDWDEVRAEIVATARDQQLVPFFGSALSAFRPTSLPLGLGLLHAALQGVFPDRHLFVADPQKPSTQIDDEQVMEQHSPEIILQGLAEGLPESSVLARLYNQMDHLPPNPHHFLLATALQHRKVPAIFTTNQDRCIEAAVSLSWSLNPIYDEIGFAGGLHGNLFQFHGAIGGETTHERERRQRSLTFTLNSMGPRLPPSKHQVLREAVAAYPLIFLGYSGSDPDIWYSLDAILPAWPGARLYWCVQHKPGPLDHRTRLAMRHAHAITIFQGDLTTILRECAAIWGLADPGPVEIPPQGSPDVQERLSRLRAWAPPLSPEQSTLAYAWVRVAVGRYRAATQLLEPLAATAAPQAIKLLAHLFAGYAYRELSEHITARKHLREAVRLSEPIDRCRHAQAMHKLGESLAAFESVHVGHLWPTQPWLHPGAAWLTRAIYAYERVPHEERAAKALGRAGLANAKLNLGQLYRRTAAYTPGLRPGLAARARQLIAEALNLLESQEVDFRVLPMALAALAADDPALPMKEKRDAIDRAIEYAERWNRDQIQIGSAYFAKGRLLALPDPIESERCYLEALKAFRQAEMAAEQSRTQLELSFILAHQARQGIARTQASWEWKFGMRTLGALKVARALLWREIVAITLLATLLVVLLGVWGLRR